MKVLLFGATGMVGAGVLIECLADPRVESVLSIVRTPGGVVHGKLLELVRSDFYHYDDISREMAGCGACFFCLGVTSAGLTEEEYHRLTYDLTIAAAEAYAAVNEGGTFCYVSGQGTDSSETGRFMWARVKGKTENRLLKMPLDAYMFRPGIIQPLKGVRSKTSWYQALYTVLGPLTPLLKRVLPGAVTTTENVGKAMIEVATSGAPRRTLENRDINALAERV